MAESESPLKERGHTREINMKNLSLQFDSSNYKWTHGKAPRGFGYWAFEYKGETIFVPGEHTLTESKKLFKSMLSERGVTGVQFAKVAT